MRSLALFFLAALCMRAQGSKPTSFCYGTIGPGIQARLQLHNRDPLATLKISVQVQTIAGQAIAARFDRDLEPGGRYETVYPPSQNLQQIWATLTVTGYKANRSREIDMHADGPLEGALITEKFDAAEGKTRTSTLTPILIQDPREKPRGIEPNKAMHPLGAFFTGDFAFIGNPRERPLELSFCGARTHQCWQATLPPRAAVSIRLTDFQAMLGISNPRDYVLLNFGGATAFCNMRNATADSAITFGDAVATPSHP